MRTVLALAVTVAAASDAFAQTPAHGPQGQSGLVISDSMSFWIEAPRGWVLDRESGRSDGPLAVLYKQGESWKTGEPVMYAISITRKIGYPAFIPAVIRSDSANWAAQADDFVLTKGDSVRTVNGAVAQLRVFQSVATKKFDTAAYVQGEERVWMIVLTARSRDAHDAARADFITLVKSYAPGPAQNQD